MVRSNLKEKKAQKDRPFDPRFLGRGWKRDIEQYEMLKRCSNKKSVAEWNLWRKNCPDEEVVLFHASLKGFYLEGADLQGINLMGADLQGAKLKGANLRCAYLSDANMRGAELYKANLRDAVLCTAKLQKANLGGTYLQGADFEKAYLEGAVFESAVTDGGTSFCRCKVSRYRGKKKGTDFSDVDLRSVRIDAGTKQLLEYNIRKANWEEWYKRPWLSSLPVRAFWEMSDYGMSTLRVIGVFFILVLLFAAIYVNWSYWLPPGIVSNLIVRPETGEATWHYFGRALIKPVYFSVITMATLGFDDMYVNKGSITGHLLLMLQVILGYVLLGALVTRFAVLFTAGGPAGRFAKEKKR